MLWMGSFFFLLLGLFIGSFLNVVIYRLPRGETIIWGRSRCPACGRVLAWRDLVPVASYLVLRGRCRYCGERISPRYVAVELLTGVVFAVLFWHFGLSASLLKYLFLSCILIAASFIDLEHYVIPDRLLLAGLLGAAVLWPLAGDVEIWYSLIGSVVAGGFLLAVAVASKGGMGMGDVKLAAVTGIYLGWPKAVLALFFATVSGGLVAVLLLILGVKGKKDAIPFGPFIAVGTLASVLWGMPVIDWYKNIIIF
ncbi:Type 4 prepilin-like proteins leader peptide-processing enzyme [Fervidicola ferrireducens]|uniref:Prepilin leader peptidase/N-methyltransferase n=1 Tax=Fervidicola ferrireducens TaxID=520764 RepID=A0A140L651_9FIRM|nr:A24 family peptidase [Fervidicola ferrireducens]KXG76026.1 Type 4 prepilin-like proteins leader peptide-processing enzyme [Fervidicola ferrireducens]